VTARNIHPGVLAFSALLSIGCDTSGFRDAYMALDSNGDRKREYFYTDTEEIFCIGKLASGVADLTVASSLRATELYNSRDGTSTPVDAFLATEDQGPGKGKDITVSFELKRNNEDEPYPAGKFACELSLDGELAETLPFEIRYPDCPVAPIFSGAACAGFVLDRTTCVGALSTPCTCKGDTWQCD